MFSKRIGEFVALAVEANGERHVFRFRVEQV